MLYSKYQVITWLKSLVFYTFLIAPFISISQNRESYSLLWKIEGSNTTKPSFLFGTMHVSDSRAFQFSDDVLKSLEQSELFALEVHPDTMITALSSKVNKPVDLNIFKNVLNKDEYRRLSERFLEVNGYALDSVEVGDPGILLHSLIPQVEKEDDKSTFVDAYLYTHARTMRKPIVGLESVETQADYFDNLDDKEKRDYILSYLSKDFEEYEKYLEELTNIYYSGDISKIDEMYSSSDYGYEDTMIERNYYMVNSILKHMEKNSIFSAVGAAHLPGKEGIIEILKSKGFKVTLVTPKFTGAKDLYTIDYKKMEWLETIDKDLGFSIELPGIPDDSIDFKSFKIYSHKSIMNKDLLSYFAFDIRKLPVQDNPTVFINTIINNMAKQLNGELIKKDSLIVENGIGYNTLTKLDNDTHPFIKSKVIIKDGIVYYLFANVNDIEKNNGYSDRFLESLKLYDPKPLPVEAVSKPGKYINELGAFELITPTKVEDISRTTPNPYNPNDEPYVVNLYRSVDYKNKNNYIFRYNDMPLGYFLEDLDEGFSGLEENFKKTSRIVGEPKNITLDGYIGKEYEMYIQDKYHAVCRVYFKGNRMYLLLKQKLNETDTVEVDDAFFNSFKFNTPKKVELSNYTANEEFSVLAYKRSKISKDSTLTDADYVKEATEVFQLNEGNGDVMYFGYNTLKDYFKVTTLNDFYQANLDGLLTYKDTLISKKDIKINTDDALEFIIKNKSTNIFSRHRMLLKNNHLYHIQTFAEESSIRSKLTDSIFNSFKLLKPRKTFDVYSSKTDRILNDLKAADTLVRNSALGAFDYYEFEREKDIDKLLGAIDVHTKDPFWDRVNNIIIDEFQNVNDSTTVSKLKVLFINEETPEPLRNKMLSAIHKLEYPDAIPTYISLFDQKPPKDNDEYTWNILRPFKDSLALANANYKTLLKTISLKDYRKDILDISKNILLDSTITLKTVPDNLDTILQYADRDLNEFIAEITDTDDTNDTNTNYLIQTYLSLFEQLPNSHKIVDPFTKKLQNLTDQSWIEFLAIRARLHNNLQVDATAIDAAFKDLYTRFELIEVFLKRKELHKVPKAYLKPAAYAKLSLYNYLGDENGFTDKIVLLKTFKHKKETYHAFEVAYGEDDKSYIGIVGPSKKIDTHVTLKRWACYTDWEDKTDDWKTQIKTMMIDFETYSY